MNRVSDGSPSINRWPLPIVALHWMAAVLILSLSSSGWVMLHMRLNMSALFALFQYHKSIGILVFGLTVMRLGVRAACRSPTPRASSRFQDVVGRNVHATLYLLTLVGALTGWLTASAAVISIPTSFFGLFTMPSASRPNQDLFEIARFAHKWIVYALLALVGLHVVATIKHQFVDRDNVLARMLPLFSRAR